MSTELGDILLELDSTRAPKSVNYFCNFIEQGDFATCHFYRVVKKNPVKHGLQTIDIIQGGVGWHKCDDLPVVPLETTRDTGLTHKNGVISLARSKPDVSASEFFICIGDQPKLDYGGTEGAGHDGFAAFGRVIEGMDVVHAIHNSPANGRSFNGDKQYKNEFLDTEIKIMAMLMPQLHIYIDDPIDCSTVFS